MNGIKEGGVIMVEGDCKNYCLRGYIVWSGKCGIFNLMSMGKGIKVLILSMELGRNGWLELL